MPPSTDAPQSDDSQCESPKHPHTFDSTDSLWSEAMHSNDSLIDPQSMSPNHQGCCDSDSESQPTADDLEITLLLMKPLLRVMSILSKLLVAQHLQ